VADDDRSTRTRPSAPPESHPDEDHDGNTDQERVCDTDAAGEHLKVPREGFVDEVGQLGGDGENERVQLRRGRARTNPLEERVADVPDRQMCPRPHQSASPDGRTSSHKYVLR
jgi:hypothetical protein